MTDEIKRICKQCGKEVKPPKRKFCSYECMLSFFRPKQDKTNKRRNTNSKTKQKYKNI